ncbi:MAG: DMT family transporter [Candidatus Aminicenantes bacterium]|nr:DMT family transporter [Candidatus Aminicenantes bacterium]
MKKNKSLVEIHVAVVLFGIAGLFGKWIALAPTLIVLGRVFFASVALALILLISKQTLRFPKKSDYFLLLSLGFLLAVHWTVFFKSIQISTVAVGLLSYSSFPVFTAFLEPLFFKEKIQIKNILYASMCVLGIFLIIPEYDLNDAVLQGVLWGLAAGLTFSVLTIFNRKLSQKYSSLVIAFYQDFFATLFLLPFFFFLRPALNLKNIILLCILGIFCTAGSHTLFIKGMKYIRAQTAAIISSLEPVYGIVIAFFFLHEIPTLRTILGGMIILLAAFSVTWSGLRQLN